LKDILLNKDVNGNPINLVGFESDKTLSGTLADGADVTIDTSGDTLLRVAKGGDSLTLQLNGDGINLPANVDYVISSKTLSVVLHNGSGADVDYIVLRG
jgi:uncharacterized protein involved in outer membrane biogenesis